MSNPITLVTSVAPHNIENQQAAIASWQRLGFAVTSLNAVEEADALAPRFPDVSFFRVSRDARSDCGKPLVYLSDIAAFLRQHGTPVCGLINSDIHLRADPETVRYLVEEARGSLLVASRMNVNGLGDPWGEIYKHGFDAFFFDKSVLDLLPMTHFCLGQPWWDFVLPACVLRPPKKLALKFIAFPFAVHLRHELKWDTSGNYEKYGLHFLQAFDPQRYDMLSKQPPEQLRGSLCTHSVHIAAMILLNSQWLARMPKA